MKPQSIYLALLSTLISFSASAAIIGNVESITQNANKTLSVKGWACNQSKASTIYVNFYVNAAPPSSNALKLISLRTGEASDAAVSSKCGTKTTAHRFTLTISKATADKYANKPLYVYGALTSSSSPVVLAGSGIKIVAASAPVVAPPVIAPPPVVAPPAPALTTKKIIGNIDSVLERSSDGAVVVKGWACDKAQNKSITVHLYANAAAGKAGAKVIQAAQANLASEAQVSTNCGTTKIPHRFEAVIPKATAKTFSNSLVFVHGISVSGGSNLTIDNSGKYAITLNAPVPVPAKTVIGTIDSVTERVSDRAVIVSGWACDQNQNKAISVHLYLNGAAGSGNAKFIQSMTTNLASGAGVLAQCGTTSNHRFQFVIPRATALLNSNVPVYIHGISVSGGPNLAIANSGKLFTPNVSQNLYLSDLMKDASGKLITGDLTIPEESQVTIDTSIDIKSLIVQGRLLCPDSGDFSIKASAIHVMGKNALLQCGTSVTPYKGKLKISIKSGTVLTNCDGVSVPCSDRNIMAMNGGTIRLIGDTSKSKWLKLAKTAMPKDTEITLTESVSWVAGDQVSLAPTGFKFKEAEDLIVKSVSGSKVVFTTPILFRHNGVVSKHQMPNKEWTVDERAEVANLTRNIQITSDGDPKAMDYKGAHMMVMVGSYAYIDGVEFSYMGRMGEMARYPFHWHRVLDGEGQYIKNSSIHHSFQRCITVHATNNTLVENNVCYDHYGHGFFLENGNETGNVITGNLGMLSRRPLKDRHILQSDIDVSSIERFPGPATFWVSNPDNEFVNNVSAGSEGTGFWMSFMPRVACNTAQCGKSAVSPQNTNTLKFDNNTARTNMVGFTWDGVENGEPANNPRNPDDKLVVPVHYYSGGTAPEIRNMKAFKSLRSAMYTRGQTMNFTNVIMADNRVNFFAAYNTVMKNTAIIATTDNFLPEEYASIPDITGARIYDGPMDLRDVDFINFNERTVNGKKFTPYAFRSVGASERFGNVVQRIRFSPQPEKMILFDAKEEDSVLSRMVAASLTDLDGSLTGNPHSVIVPNHAFNRHPSCVDLPDQSTTAMNCKYRVGFLSLFKTTNNYTQQFDVSRSDGLQVQSDNFMNKINMAFGSNYEYSFTYNDTLSNAAMIFKTGEVNDVSPVVAIHGMPKEFCNISTSAKKLTSLSALRAYTAGNAFFSDKKVIYIKAKAANKALYVSGTSDAQIGTINFGSLSCK